MKAGGILPQQKVLNLGQETADTLMLEIFPDGESSYKIYDDDGKSKDYEDREYAITEVTAKDDGEQTLIEIQSPQGGYEVPERSYKLKIHSNKAPDQVLSAEDKIARLSEWNSDTQQQNGWYYNEEEKILYIQPEGTNREDIVVTISK